MWKYLAKVKGFHHGLRTPREEIVFTARPKTQSQSQIFRYGGRLFCLPHRPNFSDISDLCLHWVSVVRGSTEGFDSGGGAVAVYGKGLPLTEQFLRGHAADVTN